MSAKIDEGAFILAIGDGMGRTPERQIDLCM
jgi:hypothetical protein